MNSFVPECLEKRLPASDLSLHPVFFTEEPRFQRVISGFVFQNYPWVGHQDCCTERRPENEVKYQRLASKIRWL